MTREKKSNIPASILARLLVRAKKTGDEYQTVLTAYVCERFLSRLAASPATASFSKGRCFCGSGPITHTG
jgi:hypothetical protein